MNEYLKVLRAIKSRPRSYQSDFSRSFATYVAEAASRGHISALDTNGRNVGAWHITKSGTDFLFSYGGCL